MTVSELSLQKHKLESETPHKGPLINYVIWKYGGESSMVVTVALSENYVIN